MAERSLSDKPPVHRGPPAAAAKIWAAVPVSETPSGPAPGPIVKAPHWGIEQRNPARWANFKRFSLLKLALGPGLWPADDTHCPPHPAPDTVHVADRPPVICTCDGTPCRRATASGYSLVLPPCAGPYVVCNDWQSRGVAMAAALTCYKKLATLAT